MLVILLISVFSCSQAVRLCVPQPATEVCEAMRRDGEANSFDLECVEARDRYDCLTKVVENEADVMISDASNVYLASERFSDRLQVIAELRPAAQQNESFRYDGIAVVRRNTIRSLRDLQGAKSCHTGYGRTAGWKIPFSNLLYRRLIKLDCRSNITNMEQDLKAASDFFSFSCVPGKWAPDDQTEKYLKMKYHKLCSLCSNPDECGENDFSAGYEGALRCLVDSAGDVAWTEVSALKKFLQQRPTIQKSDYGILCRTGSIENVDVQNPCTWSSRPWNAWLARSSDNQVATIVNNLNKAVTFGTGADRTTPELQPWVNTVLETSKPSVLHVPSYPVTPLTYLRSANFDITIKRQHCPEVNLKLCVTSPLAKEKCEALSKVLVSQRVRPVLSCVLPSGGADCMQMIKNGDAHIATVDGADAYAAYKKYALIPLVSEKYGNLEASYYAVAIVKRDSGITSFSQLKGKNSCHTGINKTSGWTVPVATLLEAGLLDSEECDFPKQIGNFFSESCVPGAKSPKYDPSGDNPSSLCELCIGSEGTNQGRCERSSEETYYGYTGAFRCLVEGGGDVAFVKHSTVLQNTNGQSSESWTKELHANDYQLLCKYSGTDEVYNFHTCHLARVPAHMAITSDRLIPLLQEEARILLLRAGKLLSTGQNSFRLFGKFKGRSDLIFKDSATGLINVPADAFHDSIKDNYYKMLDELEFCSANKEPHSASASIHSQLYWEYFLKLLFLMCSIVMFL